MEQPIQVQEKTAKPAGLLPKHVQSWILVGLALLMVMIMWLTGGKKPQPALKNGVPLLPTQPSVEVNEAKIADLQNRIQELQREQLVAQNALSQQTRLLGAATPQDPQPPSQAPPAAPPAERAQDAIAAERKNREYLSLFASNVALSYRKLPVAEPPAAPERLPSPQSQLPSSGSAEIAQLVHNLQPTAAPQSLAPPIPAAEPSSPVPSTNPETKQTQAAASERMSSPQNSKASTGKQYVLFEGTVFETVLLNRLDGTFAGPIECLLATDVYSLDRQHVLVPSGSKFLGETKKVDSFGQARLAVVFHRLLMPDGYSINLDHFSGLNQVGDAGLRDEVNNHYLRIFGVSLAIGAIGATAQAGASGALTANGTDLMRQGFAQSTAQSSSQVLDKFLNVLPTVTIREGHRVKIFLASDLFLPDYNNHTLPRDM
jgi:type IV secretion system protein TrbI